MSTGAAASNAVSISASIVSVLATTGRGAGAVDTVIGAVVATTSLPSWIGLVTLLKCGHDWHTLPRSESKVAQVYGPLVCSALATVASKS